MKNIHILATDKPSRLAKSTKSGLNAAKKGEGLYESGRFGITTFNIYITNSEEIKEGDWYYDLDLNKLHQYIHSIGVTFNTLKKIILTTDQDLINDGVQAIDDDFLQWFVNNPSCEEVEIVKTAPIRPFGSLYKIIILKEEPKHKGKELTTEEVMESRSNAYDFIDFDKKDLKEHPLKPNECFKQETLEEAAERYAESNQYDLGYYDEGGFQGIDVNSFAEKLVDFTNKWQQERSCEHNYILTTEQGHRIIECTKCNHSQAI